MCFSANASFMAAGFLALIGAACIKKNHSKQALLLDIIPLFFAAQQASEGLLWLSISHEWAYMQSILPYIFLLFAAFIWPIWIPISTLVIEPSHTRRHYLALFVMLGIITALSLYSFILLHGVQANATGNHIYYDIKVPDTASMLASIAYVLVTIIPFFISSLPAMRCFAVALSMSYIISYVWYTQHFVSVWCFFAALLSCLIFVMINRMQLHKKRGSQR